MHFGPWEAAAYGGLWISAAVLAADVGLRMAPNVHLRFPFLRKFQDTALWGFAPLVLLTIAGGIFLMDALGWVQVTSSLLPEAAPEALHNPAITRPEYLKNIGFGVDNGAGDSRPTMLAATSAITTDRLRIFVDYSIYRHGWMPKIRAPIGEIKEPVNGQLVRIPFIFSAMRDDAPTYDLWWGDPQSRFAIFPPDLSDLLPVTITRARVAIIGPSGTEQYYYFLLLRIPSQQNQPNARRFEILRGPETNWIGDWESETK
jgi:hypothetical protein